jgi:M6 family metalloprotease-like protein
MSRALAVLALVALAFIPGTASGQQAGAPIASAYDFVKFPTPACAGVGLRQSAYFTRNDCGFAEVRIDGAQATDEVTAVFSNGSTTEATFDEGVWQFDISPEADWPAGPVTVAMRVGDEVADGEGTFFLNQLGAELATSGDHAPGEPLRLRGEVFQLRSGATATERDGVGAQFRLRVVDANGEPTAAPFGPFAAAEDGTVDETLPASATAALKPTRATNWRETVRIEMLGAGFEDDGPLGSGFWAAPDGEPAGSAAITAVPDEPVLENSFVSSKGWVKPGETYPFTVRVRNFTDEPFTDLTVTVSVPDGTTLLGEPTFTVDVPAGGVAARVFEAEADTLAQDPQIVWKDLSSTATLGDITTTSHGPKVIPPSGGYETARYGDRPFPVVPVDFSDRAHGDGSSADKLATKINDPDTPGSTFNLYQEMSYGQLFPHGTVPSDGIATAGWDYEPGFTFTRNSLEPDTCRGVTNAMLPIHQQLQPERIRDGWYQLPGSTDYYGDDSKGSALIGALAGVGALQDIDSACGPTGKAVFDAAQIADPEIDYNDYDTDKDGVVDFFMMVFPGVGGNGESQLSGYDNIWPHSSDLQGAYVDENGEKGYVSDDQLTDLEGRPLFWTDEGRSKKTTQDTGIPVHVRVGPYNVNPESAIEKASVISHEYGHSLGLPDYYSTGSRETYGSWTLMASDHSQNIDIVGKKELGWVVPRVLETLDVAGWEDTKKDTNRIDWKQPDGTPYTLTGENVHNGEAYVAPLPGRQIIDPSLVPSGDHVWWSRAGNDFGCPPSGGHNLDIALPALRDVPAGTPVTLTFKSRWDIEWDYDYGFVLATTDNGRSYKSYASESGYSTAASQNPNANGCQSQYGNGLTGSSGSFESGTQTLDRVTGTYPDAPFVDDSYDLSDLAGTPATLRLTYATDPGLARPGWFIDDLKVTAGDTVIYESDFETATDTAIFNGGCREGLQTAQECTDGWQRASASEGSPAEHGYLLEMRDRSGFDLTGRGESDRGDPTFAPGVYLAYTDENHGYGNVGTDNPPAQTPLDAVPEPGSDTPNLDDAAFKQGQSFSDAGAGHVDNYSDPSREDGQWRFAFDCLGFDVESLSGAGLGPEAPGTYDLTGDVAFRTGPGCAAFNYGWGEGDPVVPPAPRPPRTEQKPGGAGPGTAAAAAAAPPRLVRLFRTTRGRRLTVVLRLGQPARVRIDVLRRGRIVRRLANRRLAAGRTLRVSARGLRRGRYTVRLKVTRNGSTRTITRRV